MKNLYLTSLEESIPLLQILSNLNIGLTIELIKETFHPMDFLFYGIAIYEGYKFSFRELSEEEILLIIKADTSSGEK